jgi:hypothetical protein
MAIRHSSNIAYYQSLEGATTAELMYRAGHSSPTVAMRYQHASQERDQALADKLGALMRAASTEGSTDAALNVRHLRGSPS